jgi:hypothetical protein
MSEYEGDPRVVLHDDGTATLPDRPGGTDGDWFIHEIEPDVWSADNPVQGFLHSRFNAPYRATFHTRDEVLAALGVQVPAQ